MQETVLQLLGRKRGTSQLITSKTFLVERSSVLKYLVKSIYLIGFIQYIFENGRKAKYKF